MNLPRWRRHIVRRFAAFIIPAGALGLTLCFLPKPARSGPQTAIFAPWGDTSAQNLQAVLDEARKAVGAPGASAAIMSNGELLWSGSSGKTDLETGLPATDNTLYSLASVTKTFTSTMVLRLYEEGKIGIDDLIEPYVPSYMPSTDHVTVRELLGMTSGYQDVEGDPIILKWLADPNHIWKRDQILERVRHLTFKPGTRYDYSNTNYVILGGIMETVSHAGVGDEFDQFIVNPVGLGGEAFFERSPAPAPRIAHGYNLQKGIRFDTFTGAHLLGVPTSVWGVMWTDGGIAATAGGVARFTDALFGGKILQPATLEMMIQPGPDHSYGLGTYRMRFDGHDWQGNDGYYNGFTAMTMYDFSRHLTITVLTNFTDNNNPASQIWNRLVRVYDNPQ